MLQARRRNRESHAPSNTRRSGPTISAALSDVVDRSVLADLLHLLENLLDVIARRLLAPREIAKGLQELPDDSLCRHHGPQLVAVPPGIQLGLRRDLERVLTQVDHQRRTAACKLQPGLSTSKYPVVSQFEI